MVARRAAVLMVIGTAAALAVKRMGLAVPMVFGTADDPINVGLVDSINRPSGNLTGVTLDSAELRPKMLDLLHQIVPQAKTIYRRNHPSCPKSQSFKCPDRWQTIGLSRHLDLDVDQHACPDQSV